MPTLDDEAFSDHRSLTAESNKLANALYTILQIIQYVWKENYTYKDHAVQDLIMKLKPSELTMISTYKIYKIIWLALHKEIMQLRMCDNMAVHMYAKDMALLAPWIAPKQMLYQINAFKYGYGLLKDTFENGLSTIQMEVFLKLCYHFRQLEDQLSKLSYTGLS
jgi:hypothetical protein